MKPSPKLQSFPCAKLQGNYFRFSAEDLFELRIKFRASSSAVQSVTPASSYALNYQRRSARFNPCTVLLSWCNESRLSLRRRTSWKTCPFLAETFNKCLYKGRGGTFLHASRCQMRRVASEPHLYRVLIVKKRFSTCSDSLSGSAALRHMLDRNEPVEVKTLFEHLIRVF